MSSVKELEIETVGDLLDAIKKHQKLDTTECKTKKNDSANDAIFSQDSKEFLKGPNDPLFCHGISCATCEDEDPNNLSQDTKSEQRIDNSNRDIDPSSSVSPINGIEALTDLLLQMDVSGSTNNEFMSELLDGNKTFQSPLSNMNNNDIFNQQEIEEDKKERERIERDSIYGPIELQTLTCAEAGFVIRLSDILNSQIDPVNRLSLATCTDSDGYTPAHRAAYNGHADCITALIEASHEGAAPILSALTHSGWQPLHCAARWGHSSVIQLIIDNGADVNAITDSGQTPLHIAVSISKSEDMLMIRECERLGASYSDLDKTLPNLPDREECIRTLLNHQEINLEILNAQCDKAIDIASRNGYEYIFDAKLI